MASLTIADALAELREIFRDDQDATQQEKAAKHTLSRISPEECTSYEVFDNHRYSRHLLAVDCNFSLLLICWDKKQQTPIHHHGNTGVLSFVRVLRGKLRLRAGYQSKCAGSSESEVSFDFPSDGVFLIDDSMGLHKTSNVMEEGDGRTVSLHLYTPPYIECRFCSSFRPECQNVGDAFVPAIHHHPPENHQLACAQEVELSTKCSHLSFANFANLVEVLQKEVQIDEDRKHSPENIAHVKHILQNMHFNEKEWRQYTKFSEGHYTRNLIGYDDKFTILLLCWEKGQMSPIHDHAGSNCWVKVLDGNLEETVYQVGEDEATVKDAHASVYDPEQVTYISDAMGVHRMGNARSDGVAVSLHVYSPPYHECHVFAEDEPLKKKVCITAAYGAEFPFLESTSEQIKGCHTSDSTTLSLFIDNVTHMLQDGCSSSVAYMMNSLRFQESEWKKYIHFSSHQYTRNLLAFNEYFSLILVCWSPGQKTPIHDHGDDRRDVFIRVLDGSLGVQRFLEDEWGQTSADLDPSASFLIPKGDCVRLHNNDMGLHQTYNASRSNCVSLHLYTPPYIECEFKLQSGQKKLLPVAYCSKDAGSGISTACESLFQFRRNIFSNLVSFVALLKNMFRVNNGVMDGNSLSRVLAGIQFDPLEWKSFASSCSSCYSRNLVAKTDYFSILILCWDKGQSSPIHDHGGSESWVRVLQGTLQESEWTRTPSGMRMEKTANLEVDSVRHISKDIVHSTSNTSPGVAYSLHIYAPAFDQCNCFDRTTGQPTPTTCGSHLRAPHPTEDSTAMG
eukprot:TRINITY_DN4070_c0_g1_i1.p1 TRINITY_DN4070_c0_g1~~TRINITY_DN4070_c0_g1_i1.p1  ORF type:complete len:789 (-),score=206.26 TRINITY_DN4070_c0_g1_i1:127-2493(-)